MYDGGAKYTQGAAMQTKLFKNGNSQAVRIPAEIAYDRTDIALTIVREGDRIIIEPTLRSAGDMLRKMQPSPGFMVEGRGDEEQKEREPW
jgi:antitoxin VapB